MAGFSNNNNSYSKCLTDKKRIEKKRTVYVYFRYIKPKGFFFSESLPFDLVFRDFCHFIFRSKII